MKSKLWIVIAAAALLAVFWCGAALADQSGTCGTNLTWTLTDQGALTISGSGEMTNYSTGSSTPWYSSRSSVKSITIEDSVTSIGRRAFYECTGVTGIRIPASVTKIGYLAFKGCSGLSSVIILNEEAEIGDSDHDVFGECASNLTLKGWAGSTAETYASAAGHAFVPLDSGSCGADLSYTYDRENRMLTISGTGKMTNYSTSYSTPWYFYRSSVRYITIADGVTSISRFAFTGCSSVNRIAIPVSVTHIGFQAFRDCEYLNKVTIANPECVIGDSDYDVFSGCSPTIIGWAGSTAETYAAAAGHTFNSLGNTSGQLGDNVYYSIYPQTGAVSITGTGPMWDYYHDSPLYDNEALSSVTISSGVSSIGENVFNDCSGLTSVTIPNSVTGIGRSAFAYCEGLTSVTIPNSVTSISKSAFSFCGSLKSVTIPNSVTSIEEDVFSYCECLTSVTIPNSVTSIGGSAFAYCKGLTGVTIPNSVTSIDDYAFSNCISLTSVTIPNSVKSIGKNVFENCTGLKGITVAAENRKYCSENGVLFDKDQKTIICYPAGKAGSSYIVPPSVTSIGDYAFFYCTGLARVTIPNSVTGIGERAFSYCTGLTYVTISNGVKSIGKSVFEKCTSLTGVTIPNSVTGIGERAFYYCTGLTYVTIPNGVTDIGDSAFYRCTGLTSVTIPNSVTHIGSEAFRICASLANVTIHNRETKMGYEAFGSCASPFYLHGHSGSTAETYANNDSSITFVALTAEMGTPDFMLPANLTAIGAEAFSGNKATIVYIPDTVTSIGSKAFANSTNLTQIRIPASVTVIPPDLFYGLSSLQLSNITIFSTPGSAAETYAKKKYMKFEVE